MTGISNQVAIANNLAASHAFQVLGRGRVLRVSGAPIPPATQTANPSVEPTRETLPCFLQVIHVCGSPLR